MQVVRSHVEQSGGCRSQSLTDVKAIRLAGNGMELEHVHVSVNRQRQACHLLAAPLLVNLEELVDLRGNGIRRLGGTAYRTDPMPQFLVLDPPRFTEIDQLDALTTQVAHLLIADLDPLAASIVLAKPPQD